MLREIDKGLAKSRVGIVLVTPALLSRLKGEGIADKELSALLARDQLIPIVHNTTYEALREVARRAGRPLALHEGYEGYSAVEPAPAFLTAPYLPGMFAGVTVSSEDGQRIILRFHWRQAFYCGVTPSVSEIWSP